jgi:hypothetical protein
VKGEECYKKPNEMTPKTGVQARAEYEAVMI